MREGGSEKKSLPPLPYSFKWNSPKALRQVFSVTCLNYDIIKGIYLDVNILHTLGQLQLSKPPPISINIGPFGMHGYLNSDPHFTDSDKQAKTDGLDQLNYLDYWFWA